MSTDLIVPAAPGAVSVIQQTALELDAAHRIATAIATTSFVPQHFRGKADEIAVAILYGATVGFDPITAIQQIYVIGGKPALYARAMSAIVQSKGHEMWVEDEADGKVTVAGRRKGSDQVQRITWTTADARRAGYTSNKKYETDPRSMLYARASGDIARRIAPDALMGLAYSVEELELGIVPQADVASTSRSGVTRLRAAVAPASAPDEVDEAFQTPAPAAEDVQDAEVVEEPKATRAQRDRLGRALKAAGASEKDVALPLISGLVGRDVPATTDLTQTEIEHVLTELANDAAKQTDGDDGWPPVAQIPGEAAAS